MNEIVHLQLELRIVAIFKLSLETEQSLLCPSTTGPQKIIMFGGVQLVYVGQLFIWANREIRNQIELL